MSFCEKHPYGKKFKFFCEYCEYEEEVLSLVSDIKEFLRIIKNRINELDNLRYTSSDKKKQEIFDKLIEKYGIEKIAKTLESL